MEIDGTEFTERELATLNQETQGSSWTYTSTHGVACAECEKAALTARIYATVTGFVASTYTIIGLTEEHAGTATRVR